MPAVLSKTPSPRSRAARQQWQSWSRAPRTPKASNRQRRREPNCTSILSMSLSGREARGAAIWHLRNSEHPFVPTWTKFVLITVARLVARYLQEQKGRLDLFLISAINCAPNHTRAGRLARGQISTCRQYLVRRNVIAIMTRMVDERLPPFRSASGMPMSSDKVVARSRAICLRRAQKSSSRLTLVL